MQYADCTLPTVCCVLVCNSNFCCLNIFGMFDFFPFFYGVWVFSHFEHAFSQNIVLECMALLYYWNMSYTMVNVDQSLWVGYRSVA